MRKSQLAGRQASSRAAAVGAEAPAGRVSSSPARLALALHDLLSEPLEHHSLVTWTKTCYENLSQACPSTSTLRAILTWTLLSPAAEAEGCLGNTWRQAPCLLVNPQWYSPETDLLGRQGLGVDQGP